jgi:hypothetical protein
VAWWTAEGRETDRARRALRLQRSEIFGREDPFAAIIRCTADPARAEKRTRSKWSRVLRYAAVYKPDSEPLDRFIRRKGASTPAPLGSRAARGEVRGRRDGQRGDDKMIRPCVGLDAFARNQWRAPPGRSRSHHDPSNSSMTLCLILLTLLAKAMSSSPSLPMAARSAGLAISISPPA